ncbi:MAG: hypothetical protein WCV79_02990 [Candidatus Paceibacterota bacterium]
MEDNIYKRRFFSLAELKQPVNQWLCIAFMSLWLFWFMLFYVTKKTEAIGESFSGYVNLPTQELRKADAK